MPTVTFSQKQKLSTKQAQGFKMIVFQSINSVSDVYFIIFFCLNCQEAQN